MTIKISQTKEFLKQSNWIEQEYSTIALDDSIKAWKYAVKNKDNINVNYILNIHLLLMKRLNRRIAGKTRTCDVWIGGKKKRFITTSLMHEDLQQWIDNTFNEQSQFEKQFSNAGNFAINQHVIFENIHPFEDGNGRVGRILYNIHRLSLHLPIHVIKEKYKLGYYEWFNI